jgi:hypothetical protein
VGRKPLNPVRKEFERGKQYCCLHEQVDKAYYHNKISDKNAIPYSIFGVDLSYILSTHGRELYHYLSCIAESNHVGQGDNWGSCSGEQPKICRVMHAI